MRAKSVRGWALNGVAVLLLYWTGSALCQGADSAPGLGVASVPREVLAFYYPWYGPSHHWGKVDAARHEIEQARHYPVKGAYSSHDTNIIAWQIDAAKAHGVTGFIASWWGRGTFEDQSIPLLLQTAEPRDFRITVYWEIERGSGLQLIPQAVRDLTYLLKRYATNRAFLTVRGRPVIFLYGRVMEEVPPATWPKIIAGARADAGDFLLVADGYSERNAHLFDGLHTYNICTSVKGKNAGQLKSWAARHYAEAVKLARAHGRIACVTVIPGYDDTKIRSPGLKVDRGDGMVYRTLWEEAIRAQPDWVLITSWNEWHEGSEIEPSLEEGDEYLRITGESASRFLAGRR
jgi:glycoprotein endo-alpha-1,2-mannosidase